MTFDELTLTDAGALLAAGRISPVELTAAVLDRIATVDPHLSSYTATMPEQALAQAKRAEREIASGRYRSPLHGIPIGVKDIIYTTGAPTGCGMPVHREFRPDHEATVVAKLRAAGAVIVGKTTTTEGAGMFHHPSMPAAKNPWHPDHWTGVSSSGSAVAVAADLCFAALGSDTGGSIRFPSAANGVTGLKPTWGRVSRYGVFPLAESLDTIGPIARTAEDCAAVLGVIAGIDANDPTSLPDEVPDFLRTARETTDLRGTRIGIDRQFAHENAEQSVLEALEEALGTLRRLGASVVDITFPDATELRRHIPALSKVEAALAHAETFPAEAARYGDWLSGRIAGAESIDPVELGRAVIERDRFSGALAHLLATVDAVFVPVLVRATPTWAEISPDPQSDLPWMFKFGSIFNHARVPTITLPCGSASGLPLAFQLVGRRLSEARLLAIGHAFQRVTDWHRRRPTMDWIRNVPKQLPTTFT